MVAGVTRPCPPAHLPGLYHHSGKKTQKFVKIKSVPITYTHLDSQHLNDLLMIQHFSIVYTQPIVLISSFSALRALLWANSESPKHFFALGRLLLALIIYLSKTQCYQLQHYLWGIYYLSSHKYLFFLSLIYYSSS